MLRAAVATVAVAVLSALALRWVGHYDDQPGNAEIS